MRSLTVNLADRSYEVRIGAGLLGSLGPMVNQTLRTPAGARAALIADAGVPIETLQAAQRSLHGAGFNLATESIVAEEDFKSLATLQHLLTVIAGHRLERHEPVISLGGGIVGDIAGFAAAVYRRGVPIVHCPTTLLSMVDASIGGKTGANLFVGDSLRKNLVGAFWQPSLVLADVATLDSLPSRHVSAGLAECLKHALIGAAVDIDLLPWTRDNLPGLCAKTPELLSELVERNARVKARFVEGDERETAPADQGGRALLNLGHTFGHAIETIPTLSPTGDPAMAPLMHGEAVALGMVAAASSAVAAGMLTSPERDEVVQLVSAAGLPVKVAGLPPDDEIIAAMSFDKKVQGGRLRLVLPRSLGRADVVVAPPHSVVKAGIASIRA